MDYRTSARARSVHTAKMPLPRRIHKYEEICMHYIKAVPSYRQHSMWA